MDETSDSKENEEVRQWLHKQGLSKYAEILNINGFKRFSDCFSLNSDVLKLLGIAEQRDIDTLLKLRRQKRVPLPQSPNEAACVSPDFSASKSQTEVRATICDKEKESADPLQSAQMQSTAAHLTTGTTEAAIKEPVSSSSGAGAVQPKVTPPVPARQVKGIHIKDMIQNIDIKSQSNASVAKPSNQHSSLPPSVLTPQSVVRSASSVTATTGERGNKLQADSVVSGKSPKSSVSSSKSGESEAIAAVPKSPTATTSPLPPAPVEPLESSAHSNFSVKSTSSFNDTNKAVHASTGDSVVKSPNLVDQSMRVAEKATIDDLHGRNSLASVKISGTGGSGVVLKMADRTPEDEFSLEFRERSLLPVNMQIRTLSRGVANVCNANANAERRCGTLRVIRALPDADTKSSEHQSDALACRKSSESQAESERNANKTISSNEDDDIDIDWDDSDSESDDNLNADGDETDSISKPYQIADDRRPSAALSETKSFTSDSHPAPKTISGFLMLLPGSSILASGKFWAVFNGQDLRLFKNEKARISQRIMPMRLADKVLPLTNDRSQFLLMLRTGQFPFEVAKGEENKRWVDALEATVKSMQEAAAASPAPSKTSDPVRVSKEGWLMVEREKKRSFLTSAARARKFVVIVGGVLRYFGSPEERHTECPIHEIRMELATVKLVMLTPSKVDRTKLRLIDACANVPFLLTFESPTECDEWNKALQMAILVALDKDNGSNDLSKTLKAIYENVSNRYCADCGASEPEWASINLGIMICENCAGCHRRLSVNYSKVQSVRLDTRIWTNTNVKIMTTIGNSNANEFWEGTLPSDFVRSALNIDSEKRADFIRNKYVEKRYCGFHPFYGDDRRLNEELCEVIRNNNRTLIEAMKLFFSGASLSYATTENGVSVSVIQLARDKKRFLLNDFFINNLNVITVPGAVPSTSTSVNVSEPNDEDRSRQSVQFAGSIWKSDKRLQAFQPRHAVLDGLRFAYDKEGDLKGSFYANEVVSLIREKCGKYDHSVSLFVRSADFFRQHVIASESAAESGCWFDAFYRSCCPEALYRQLSDKTDSRSITDSLRKAGHVEIHDGHSDTLSVWLCFDTHRRLNFYWCPNEPKPKEMPISWLFDNRGDKKINIDDLSVGKLNDRLEGVFVGSIDLRKVIECDGYTSSVPASATQDAQASAEKDKEKEKNLKSSVSSVLPSFSGQSKTPESMRSPQPATFYILTVSNKMLRVTSKLSKDADHWQQTIKRALQASEVKLSEQALSNENVPIALARCCAYVRAHGINLEGIYRKTGVESNVKALVDSLVKNPHKATLPRPSESQVHEVATAIRRYLRMMDDSLLTNKLHAAWMRIPQEATTGETRVRMYKDVLKKLDPVHHATVYTLCLHLAKIADNSAVNKMSLDNLATVFISVFFGDDDASARLIVDPTCHAVTADLIRYHNELFVIEAEVERRIEEGLKKMLEALEAQRDGGAELKNTAATMKLEVIITDYPKVGDRFDAFFDVDASTSARRFVELALSTVRSRTQSSQSQSSRNDAESNLSSRFIVVEFLLEGKLVRPLRDDELIVQTALGWNDWLPETVHHRFSPSFRIRRDFRNIDRSATTLAAAQPRPSAAVYLAAGEKKDFRKCTLRLDDDGAFVITGSGSNQPLCFNVRAINVYEGADPERVSNAARFYITLIERSKHKNSLTNSSFTNLLSSSTKSNAFVGVVICFQTDAERASWLSALLDAQVRVFNANATAAGSSDVGLAATAKTTSPTSRPQNLAASHRPPPPPPPTAPYPAPRGDKTAPPVIPTRDRTGMQRRAAPPSTSDAHQYIDMELPNFTASTGGQKLTASVEAIITDRPTAPSRPLRSQKPKADADSNDTSNC